jgi:hypothetical protein
VPRGRNADVGGCRELGARCYERVKRCVSHDRSQGPLALRRMLVLRRRHGLR